MRAVFLIVLVVVMLLAPVWVSLLAAAAYAMWRPAYELIAIGVLLDAFLLPYPLPEGFLFTAMLSGIVLLAEAIKPYMSYYATVS